MSPTINILQQHFNKIQVDITTHYGLTTDLNKSIQILTSIQIWFPNLVLSRIESLHENGIQELSSQVNCKICLKSAGLFEFFVGFDWLIAHSTFY